MNTSEQNEREFTEIDSACIGHGVVDEAAGDEGIDDTQPDETETVAVQA